jgi:hypothetical protein
VSRIRLSEHRARGLFKVRVDLSAFYGEGAYCVMREPTGEEVAEVVGEGNAVATLVLLEKCIEEHNFDGDEGQVVTNEVLAEEFKRHGAVVITFLRDWMAKLPLGSSTNGSSGALDGTSSKGRGSRRSSKKPT